jgi:hypothetical protein
MLQPPVLMDWPLARPHYYILFYVSGQGTVTKSQFPEDYFLDTNLASHDANARAEALATTTDGDYFLQQYILI